MAVSRLFRGQQVSKHGPQLLWDLWPVLGWGQQQQLTRISAGMWRIAGLIASGLGQGWRESYGLTGMPRRSDTVFPVHFAKEKNEFKSTFQERTVGFVGDMAWIETDYRQKCVSSTQQVMHLWINSICNQILLSEWSIELPIGLPVVLSTGLPSEMPT